MSSNPLHSLIGNLINGLVSLVPALTTQQQNGNSLLGVLSAPTLPPFLINNPIVAGFPWGPLTASGNDPYTSAPFTGATRNYDFTVTRGVIAPDGVQKQVILINGQFPGPTIEANWGDQIMVTVHNRISNPAEGIGLHWHGLLQKKTPYYDGVASVSQCPITPGDSFTYSFQADLYGTTWYHSHYSAQYAGGLFGPLIIYGPKNAPYDIDLGPMLLTDYYHKPYFEIVEGVMTNTGDTSLIVPKSDNNLINGKMNYNCSVVAAGTTCTPNAGLAKFRFHKGKTHRLRLINAGADGLQRFSIDGHSMTVIANDFVPVDPYVTNVVTLGIGQRTDVLVTANVGSLTDAFWIRSNISTICSSTTQPDALAVAYYDNANSNTIPHNKPWNIPDPGTCSNDALEETVPYYPMASVPTADTTLEMNINFGPNASNIYLWTINGQTFCGDYNSPILLLANQGNFSYPADWNVYNFHTNTSINFVINNPTGFPSHPMHMHGHNFFVLHQGPGKWDGTVVRATNPQRRDVQILPGGEHIVLQIQTDNPGAWPLHCHIAWHVSGGLYLTILERPDDIRHIQIPSTSFQNCRNWGAFTGTHIPDQIDSGL